MWRWIFLCLFFFPTYGIFLHFFKFPSSFPFSDVKPAHFQECCGARGTALSPLLPACCVTHLCVPCPCHKEARIPEEVRCSLWSGNKKVVCCHEKVLQNADSCCLSQCQIWSHSCGAESLLKSLGWFCHCAFRTVTAGDWTTFGLFSVLSILVPLSLDSPIFSLPSLPFCHSSSWSCWPSQPRLSVLSSLWQCSGSLFDLPARF